MSRGVWAADCRFRGTFSSSSEFGLKLMKLLFKIGAGVIVLVVLALVAVNMLISADAVRDRIAARVKEQTGRDLAVHGSSSLLLMPSPHIVLTDVEITDPESRAGADLTIARLALDVSFGQLLSRQVDANRVVMERPVLTVRLKDGVQQQQGDAGQRAPRAPVAPPRAAEAAPLRFIAAETGGGSSRRDIMLKDVRIEDGTVRIIYNRNGDERRIEHIDASLSLPHIVDPLTAKGDFDWKGLRVGFDLKLESPADLETRSARLDLALDTDAIDANFGGYVAAKPAFNAEGDLAIKSQSVPSVLAWMRQQPSSVTAIGSGELNSHVAWQQGEISFTQTRFALSHATGQGQAVLTLKSPRPYLRAAFALETLDLNPFFAGAPGPSGAAQPPGAAEHVQPKSGQATDGSGGPDGGSDAGAEAPPPGAPVAEGGPAPQAPGGAPVYTPNVMPAAFDADVNINVSQTKVARLTIGPSSLGLSLRDGVLDAKLSDMQLYDGQGNGKFTLDASKPVPAFTSHVVLDNVSMQPLLAGVAGFNLLAGRAKVELELDGTGRTADEMKHSLAGDSTIDITNGAIEGINLTELIAGIGAGRMPELDQGPGAKTTFSDLGGTFTIASGVAESHDLEMTAPLLEVTARGTVDFVTGSVDFLTQPEIVAGPEGKGGANALAGLSVPVRIEGPFAKPTFKPEIKGLFSNPEQASKTVNQIGELLQKNLKGKPVGEAIGRMLGNIRIGGGRGNSDDDDAAPLQRRAEPQAEPEPESDKPRDPDLQEILR
jgi:AsmA protein